MAAPAGAEVYFIAPQNGATLHSPVTIRFGLKGMGIAPAGIKFDNTGHHHLLVDTDYQRTETGCTDAGDRQDRAFRQGANRDRR